MLRVPLPALLLLASASLLLAGTSLAVAEAHYVTPAGQATWEQSLDQRTPCSLATANARAQAGDTVYMLSGTYQTSIAPEHSGTSAPGGRIVYSSQPGGSVLIRDADHAILLEGRSYISVHGIHAFNCRQFLVIRQGHHNDIGHCHFEQNQTELVWMGSWVHDNSTYNRIHNSS
ncbi:MAG: hypothetical protein HOH74_00165, partial [Gemmatimonadetes bacterium]|nr:hypothetical protein [Gemmatimonadota bacterium]